MTLNCLRPTSAHLMSETLVNTTTQAPTTKPLSTMTMKKTSSSSLATRSIDSFMLFESKEFVSGYQPFVTIQPINRAKTRGWFIKKEELSTCEWSATEDQFAKGSVIWNYKQTFGMAPNTSIQEGINFTQPRIQILLRSPLMVEETAESKQIIGTFDNPEVKSKWDADKLAADLSNSKGDMYTRKYSVRTKYLVFILTTENKRAHRLPMVLTLKGLNGTDLAQKIKLYEKEMSKCLSKVLDSEIPLVFNEKFYATTVFTPRLVNDMRGANNIEICAIEEFDIPDYSTKEMAVESLSAMSIPDEDRESTWKHQILFKDYINQHAKQDAAKLNGSYGIQVGVEILPEIRGMKEIDVTALSSAKDPVTGEDDSLL
jgi:hypothetical protein